MAPEWLKKGRISSNEIKYWEIVFGNDSNMEEAIKIFRTYWMYTKEATQYRKREKGVTRHHIRPRSRKGGNGLHGNVIWKAEQQHKAFHKLFSNALPTEVIGMIRKWFEIGDKQV